MSGRVRFVFVELVHLEFSIRCRCAKEATDSAHACVYLANQLLVISGFEALAALQIPGVVLFSEPDNYLQFGGPRYHENA